MNVFFVVCFFVPLHCTARMMNPCVNIIHFYSYSSPVVTHAGVNSPSITS